jgi:hypothetical protein
VTHDTSGRQPQRIRLTAGALSATFEEGKLRYIKVGDHEVLRGIYAAVRDRNWGTPPGVLTDLNIDQQPDSFRVSFTSTHQQGDIHFVWRGVIEGTPSTLSFDFDGEALSTFIRSRLGFCVLHPVSASGAAVTLEHDDGSREDAQFPTRISPHQPFLKLRAMTHEVTPDIRAEIRFEGDMFETEDQRQWTDASFKTYCTPLAIPYPVTVEKGTRVHQKISVAIHGDLPAEPAAPSSNQVRLMDSGQTVALPKIGFAASQGGLTANEAEKLAALKPAHIRVHITIVDGAARLDGVEQAQALNAPLEIAFRVTDVNGDIASARAWAQTNAHPIARWLVFDDDGVKTTPEIARAAHDHLREFAPVYGGTDHFFTELNRNRPPVDMLDGVCFSVNPQVHAFDNASLIEALGTLQTIVENARLISGGKPVAVSPVTFKIRENPNATGGDPDEIADELPESVDPRQMSLFGAGWTLGAIKYLALGGADSVTFYETTGWLGVIERDDGSPLPEHFPSQPGTVFPVYDLFRDVRQFAAVSPLQADDPLALEGVVLRKGERSARLIANLTHEALHVNDSFVLQAYEIRSQGLK